MNNFIKPKQLVNYAVQFRKAATKFLEEQNFQDSKRIAIYYWCLKAYLDLVPSSKQDIGNYIENKEHDYDLNRFYKETGVNITKPFPWGDLPVFLLVVSFHTGFLPVYDFQLLIGKYNRNSNYSFLASLCETCLDKLLYGENYV